MYNRNDDACFRPQISPCALDVQLISTTAVSCFLLVHSFCPIKCISLEQTYLLYPGFPLSRNNTYTSYSSNIIVWSNSVLCDHSSLMSHKYASKIWFVMLYHLYFPYNFLRNNLLIVAFIGLFFTIQDSFCFHLVAFALFLTIYAFTSLNIPVVSFTVTLYISFIIHSQFVVFFHFLPFICHRYLLIPYHCLGPFIAYFCLCHYIIYYYN